MQQSRLLTWARNLYILGLLLATIAIIPTPWFPFQLGKVAAFALCFSLAAIFFLLGGGWREFWSGKGAKASLLVLLLPIVYFVSFFSSVDRSVGIKGFSLEGDTAVFVVLCALAFLFSFGLFRTWRGARMLLVGMSGAIAAAAIFQILLVVLGPSIAPFAVFEDRSVNLIGKWNDLGLLAGLLATLALGWLEFAPATTGRRVLGGVLLAALAFLLAVVQFPLAWTLIFCFSLIFAAASFLVKRPSLEGTPEDPSVAVPWIPIAGAVVSALFLLWGSLFSSGLTSIFPVSSLEVRPSFSSTLDVVRASHGDSAERFFLGTGPQTFGEQWLLNKPAEVNQSPFWNLDFNVGFSTLLTALGSVGILGALAWLIPLLLALVGLIRMLRSAVLSATEKLLGSALAISAVYVWVTILFYVPSQNIVLFGFTLCGALLGFSLKARPTEVPAGRRSLALVGSLVLIALVLFTTGITARRAVASALTNAGLYALGQNDPDLALSRAARAQSVEQTADNLRLAVDAGSAKLQQIAATPNPTQQTQAQFAAAVQQIIPQAQAAIAAAPQDYRAYFSLGNLYGFLSTLGVTGAYENAKQIYQSAAQRNPTNPQIPLALARVEATKSNNKTAVEANLTKALTLKPDYTDAMLFAVQYSVSNNDLPQALNAAKAAVQSAPGVPSIWFQLGLLLYTNNDTQSAIPVLEQALKLQPDYANAQYFLGLSYAAQNRPQDALAQFQALAKTNPDNAEIKQILANLQAGKKPFDGAKPPVSSSLESRTAAPISQ